MPFSTSPSKGERARRPKAHPLLSPFVLRTNRPTETNNGFLRYEDPTTATAKLYNPLTGVTNSRTVEAHARGSAESGMHIENTPLPGRVGSDFQSARGKIDYVANYCGTYAMYPSQVLHYSSLLNSIACAADTPRL